MRRICTIGMAIAGVLALATHTRAGDPVPGDKALLVVKLPADSTLRIGTSDTKQTGAERWFLSPSLEPGRTYSYEVSAVWPERGKDRRQVLTAVVSAGKRTEVDFLPFVGGEKVKPPVDKIPVEKIEQPPEEKKPADQPKAEAPKSRTFLFTYAATVKDVPKDKTARIWIPLPRSTKEQDVAIESKDLPGKPEVGAEKVYGNEMFYVEAKPDAKGEIPLKLIFKVTRREVVSSKDGYKQPAIGENLTRFLQPDTLVPLGGKSLELIKDKKLPTDEIAEAKLFYDIINVHMKYDKSGTGWGRGDADWACDSKVGNCTDFHSVFIALARAQKIPAKFEMGFSIPEKHGEGTIGGYHCWAWFLPKDKQWFPVDISEANRHPDMKSYYFGNLTEDRVQFTTGRDINLVPKQAGKALNYFIFPYVEVDGQPLAVERVVRSFSYRDVSPDNLDKKK